MTRPDEHDSQMMDYVIEPQLPSSPPQPRCSGEKERGSDDTLSDPALAGHETQAHESLGSCIEETQFVPLEFDTQDHDELGPAFQEAAEAPQTVAATTQAATRAPDAPPFLISTIERPKGINIEDGAPGFKFMKAPLPPKSGDFARHPGKASNSSLNVNENPSSATTSEQNALVKVPPKFQQTSVPSNPQVNQDHSSSEHKQVPADSTKESTPTKNLYLPLLPAKPERNKEPETPQQVPRTVEPKVSPMPKPAFLLNLPSEETHRTQSAPQNSVLEVSTKTHKCNAMKQPFPEVFDEQPPGRRIKGIPALNQPRSAAGNHPLRPLDVNRAVPYSAPTKRTFEPYSNEIFADQGKINTPCYTATITPGHRETLSGNNSNKAQTIAIRDTSDGAESLTIQPDAMLPPSPELHHDENQISSGKASIPSEQVLASHHLNIDSEILPVEHAHTSQLDIGDRQNQPDSDPFQPASQPQSRPQSSLSNTAKLRSRPLGTDDLVLEGVSEAPALNVQHPKKVQKSTGDPNRAGGCVESQSQSNNQRQDPLATLRSIRSFCQNYSTVEEAVKEWNDQKRVLESQQVELEKFAISTEESRRQIELLQNEKVALTAKVKRFTEISARYKAHMNDVVQAQKHLLEEKSKIKNEYAKIREESKAALHTRADRENHEEKLRIMIHCARDIRPSVEKMEQLTNENAQRKNEVEKCLRTNELLQSELNARMLDLGRERHSTEQLQKSLNAQNDFHRELVETLKRGQTTIIDEFTKEGSVLASIINSEISIQTKINELSAFVNTVNSREPILPPTFIKIVEDLYTRIENKLQASENQDISLNETSLRLFEDLKERINQVRLDEDVKTSLNERISELRESNAALMASGSARELECQVMAKRIEQTKQELSSCLNQLTAKSEEVAALRALPKNDPILLGKIYDLESSQRVLDGQINTLNQEASKVKEELVSSQMATQIAQEYAQGLQSRLTEAQIRIKTLVEDKKKMITTRETEIEKACQEIAKSAQAAKLEAKLHHNCTAKNLEERRSEAEQALALVQEELQKSQEERASCVINFDRLQEELSAYKKQVAQQLAYIKRSERVPPRDEFERREEKLERTIAYMADMKTYFEAALKETAQKSGDAVISHQNETENLIKKVDALEKEKALLEEQKSEIQKNYSTFKTNVDRSLRQSGILLGAATQSVDEWASKPLHTPRQMCPPSVPISKLFANQRLSSASSDSHYSQAGLSNNEAFRHSMPGTPKDALPQNELKLISVTQRTPSHQDTPIKASDTQSAMSDIASGGGERLQSASTIVRTNPVVTKSASESSSPYKGTPKPLRPANRKSSGLSQSVQIQEVTTTIERHALMVSSFNPLASRIDSRSLAAHDPYDSSLISAEPSCRSSGRISSTITPLPKVESPIPFSPTKSATNKEQAAFTPTQSDTAPFSGAPRLESSSPLSDIDPSFENLVDLLVGYDDVDLHKAHLEMIDSDIGAAKREAVGRRPSVSTDVPRVDTATGVKFKDTPASHQFSDGDDVSGVNSSRCRRLSTTDESARRRQPLQLKSVLKKTTKTQEMSSTHKAQVDVFQIPKSAPMGPILTKATTRTTVSKQQPPSRKGKSCTVGSSYNRIVSGSKSNGSSESSMAPLTMKDLAAAKQAVGNGEMSPLMSAPKRNSRKRSSEEISGSIKPFKQPRISLPTQSRKESRTVIPDSQEGHYRY